MVQLLKYGNTNTYYVKDGDVGVLVDTDWAGTLPAFFKEIKRQGISIDSIKYLLVTHYHPDHMGIAGELMEQGVQLVVMDLQQEYIHFSDSIFEKDKRVNYSPIDLEKAIIISCEESRSFLAQIGIAGEIIATPGHSEDSISLLLDEGIAIVGDLYPLGSASAFQDEVINNSWKKILSYNVKKVYYGHAKEGVIDGLSRTKCKND